MAGEKNREKAYFFERVSEADGIVDLDKRNNPIKAERQEAIKMANLAVCKSVDSVKAKVAIKIDIVKPIPPINPKPTMCGQ
jgi:hypothetical protein